MLALVTGGAGFIGSYLVEHILRKGNEVRVIDNFSSGSEKNLRNAIGNRAFQLIRGDVIHLSDVAEAVRNSDIVFHFAANPEVRLGDNRVHFEVNLRGTFNVLQAMLNGNVRKIVFASSSTVYGEASLIPTPESYCPLRPISVYGAAKLASESLISAYCESYGIEAIILRFANVVGPRMTHGVVHDFVRKLKQNPRKLEILGDGTQRKSYLFIEDAIRAIDQCTFMEKSNFEIYNVGSEDDIEVKRIADIVVEEMGLKDVAFEFADEVSGGRGWIGDVKFMRLDVTKLRSLGWRPRYSSQEAIRLAVKSIIR